MRLFFSLFFSCILFINTIAQKMTPEEYISKYYPLAVEEMNLYKIPASITLAQGLIETENGNSLLVTKANNHFGIKCKAEWTGSTHIHDDDKKNECFRSYANAEESFRDHSIFLLKPRYSNLFNYEMSDYRSWAFGLKQAGYATNPQYPAMLIKFIEDYKLYEFDKFGLEKAQLVEKPKEILKPLLSQEELLKQRKALANNIDLVIVDDSFDIYQLASHTRQTIGALMEINDIEGEQSLRIGQNFFLQKKGKSNAKEKHIVLVGESLYDISQIYGVSLKQLRRYNKLESWEQPYIGESIYLNKIRDDFMKTRPFYTIDKERKTGNLNLFIPIEIPATTASSASSDVGIQTITTEKIMDTAAPTKIENTTPPVKKIKEPLSNSIPNSSKVWVNHKVKAKENIFRISRSYGVTPSEIFDWNAMSVEQGLKIGQILRIQTSYPNGQNINAPNTEEILPVKTYEPPPAEPKKPKAVILKAPPAKAIDSSKIVKPEIKPTAPPMRIKKITMADLYKSVIKDTTPLDTSIRRRIKLTTE